MGRESDGQIMVAGDASISCSYGMRHQVIWEGRSYAPTGLALWVRAGPTARAVGYRLPPLAGAKVAVTM